MRKPAATFTFLLFIFLAAVPARAVMDSVSTALDTVNGFYAEAASLMDSVDEASQTFVVPAQKEKERTLENLRSIGWAKKPSRSRYREVRGIVEAYTSGVISSIEALKPGLPAAKAVRVDEITEQLQALREFKLKELEETLKIESYEKKGPKPVPLMDRGRTPFEKRPGETPGIWFR